MTACRLCFGCSCTCASFILCLYNNYCEVSLGSMCVHVIVGYTLNLYTFSLSPHSVLKMLGLKQIGRHYYNQTLSSTIPQHKWAWRLLNIYYRALVNDALLLSFLLLFSSFFFLLSFSCFSSLLFSPLFPSFSPLFLFFPFSQGLNSCQASSLPFSNTRSLSCCVPTYPTRSCVWTQSLTCSMTYPRVQETSMRPVPDPSWEK